MSIRTEELISLNCYEGSAEELIAAGLVRADQFPPAGRLGITFHNGKYVHGRCKLNEGYLRVEVHPGFVRLFVGITAAEKRSREESDRRYLPRWAIESPEGYKRAVEAREELEREELERLQAQEAELARRLQARAAVAARNIARSHLRLVWSAP